MKTEPNFGNLPGRRIFWQSGDKRTAIIRYCHGVFGLEYDGKEVMPEASFERINAYVWAEFIESLNPSPREG